MIDRERVLDIIDACRTTTRWHEEVSSDDVEELCRVYLAYLDAPQITLLGGKKIKRVEALE